MGHAKNESTEDLRAQLAEVNADIDARKQLARSLAAEINQREAEESAAAKVAGLSEPERAALRKQLGES